jgi:hypothetical protein
LLVGRLLAGTVPEQDRRSLAVLMAVAAWALAAAFALAVLVPLMPPLLLDPAWQIRLCGVVVSQAPLALLALILLHGAAILLPGNRLITTGLRRWRHWACFAALGFLLLLPLQAFATHRGISQMRAVQAEQLQGADRRYRLMREAIATAPSFEILEARLLSLRGPRLTPADRSLPLPQLRPQLDTALEQAHVALQNRSSGPSSQQLLMMVQDGVRLPLSSLAYAAAFAAGAQRRQDRKGLPTVLLNSWRKWRGRKPPRRRQGQSSSASPA